MKICVLSFSGRKYGNCYKIAQLMLSSYKNDTTVFYDFSENNITPCEKCNYQCFKDHNRCPYFDDDIAKMYNDIINSDIAFYIIPNYCDYPCANYFIFNERSQCFFQGDSKLLDKYLSIKKKFVVISNTNTENFKKVFEYQIESDIEPNILFLSAKKYSKISINGDLTDSGHAMQDIKNFIEQN